MSVTAQNTQSAIDNHELVQLIRTSERRLESAGDLDPLLAAMTHFSIWMKPKRSTRSTLSRHRPGRRKHTRGAYKFGGKTKG